MANPQPTDAHLRVAHSINEAIMTRDFTKRQRKILDLILRLSWGCGRKDAYIPHQRDFSVVGVHEVDVKKELNWLEVSQVVIRQGSFYWFNKDYDQWQVSRVKPYNPEKLSELLRLNLNGNRPEFSETLKKNLVKHESKTKQNTKPATSKSASPQEKERNNKENKTSAAKSLEEYKEELRSRYPDLDFDLELEKFEQYWSEGGRKLKRPKLALLNWMEKAREIKKKGGNAGETHRGSARSLPPSYQTPEQHRKAYQHRMES